MPEKTDEDNLNDQFQTFIENYNNAYNDSPGWLLALLPRVIQIIVYIVKGDMKNVPIPKRHSFEKLLEVFADEDEKLLEIFDGEDYTKYNFHQKYTYFHIYPQGKNSIIKSLQAYPSASVFYALCHMCNSYIKIGL